MQVDLVGPGTGMQLAVDGIKFTGKREPAGTGTGWDCRPAGGGNWDWEPRKRKGSGSGSGIENWELSIIIINQFINHQ